MWRLVLLLCIIGLPAPAFAWRQTQTCLVDDAPAPTATPYCTGDERPRGLTWGSTEVHYAVNRRGSDQFPTPDGEISPELLAVIDASFDAWKADCSPFSFVSDGLTDASSFSRDDGINLVVFQDNDWPYGASQLAVTTVTATGEGLITNADLELNGADYDFAIVESNSTAWDVQNTITHEAGHILGLDHDAVPDSTMEFEAQPGETKKRDLAADDIEGLCAIYPFVEEMEPVEEPTDEGCCRTAGGATPTPLSLALLLAIGAIGRRQFRPAPRKDEQ